MSTFEESLKKTVLGLGANYRVAEKDLFEETTLASGGVERVTEGKARLALHKSAESPEQTQFTLYVAGGGQLSEVSNFMISTTGYPIKVASDIISARLSMYDTVLENRQDISKYYYQLASNADSRLALQIAFLLRTDKTQKQKEKTK
jgi:hypothetical protein